MNVGRIVLVVAGLAAMAVTATLGHWQWSRMIERQALDASLAQAEQQLPVGESALADAAALHRRIVLHGDWVAQHTVFLDNRMMGQRSGFYVLTPLRLAAGGVVLVLRGWAPRNFADRMVLPPVATPAGEVRVEGRIVDHAPAVFALGADSPGAIRQNIDLAAFGVETGLPLAPVMVQQTGAPSDGLARDWPPPASGADTNLNYAIQWFSLCGLIGFLLLWFQIVRPLRALRHHEPGS